ncbi:MAG: hypothetical protein KC550_00860 [Nanoarchaeota archaeon]|nr:hypothetical protein [Nanoarchaeota archaeon]
MNLKNEVDSDLDFDIEVIYKKENLVVSSKSLTCGDLDCEVKLDLDRIFFDSYEIIIKTKYSKKFYEKKLNFKLKKPESKNKLVIKSNYYFDLNSTNYSISGKIILEKKSKLILETYPSNKPENDYKTRIELVCDKKCDFNMPITSNIVYGKYNLNLYLPDDVLTKNFFIKPNNLGLKTSFESKSSYLNLSDFANLSNSSENLILLDMFGKKREVDISKNKKLKNIYAGILDNSSNRNNTIKLKPKINSINNLNNIKTISNLNSNKIVGKSQISKNLSLIAPSFLDDNGSSTHIVYQDESITFNNGNSLLDLNFNSSKDSNTFLDNPRKVIPGIYKKEKIVRYNDGSEDIFEDYFAYGLISINTKKPLYLYGETTQILIVVLDKWGYLVSDASILLNISKPSGENLILTTENFDIIETEKAGVYSTEIISDELGNYGLYAQVDLNDMLVDINSYYNVVENYSFDILRDVPATIDPWEGPFNNTFTIDPLDSYSGNYDFVEIFSSDFTQIETDADEVKIVGDTTYLIWRDLSGISNPWYSAQVPLKSPVLYYLGNAYVDYGLTKEFRFYENRSWLFAIDPAAKVCDFTSPCICGASCSGGGEPGDGTIDGATDGNTNYEYVNDLRVRDINGSYFGTGDVVEICMDSQTDSSNSGDRVTIGYKDATSAWANGHVVQEWQHDNNNLNTDCVNVTLTSHVGVHNFRGKVVWEWNTEPANQISSTRTYRDHDDINITVLARKAAAYTQWDVFNGTSTGNGLKVIRGKNATVFAKWDKALQSALVRHNGNTSFVNYVITNLNNNYTNYSLLTSNLTQFSQVGIINISYIDSYDFYFNLSNKTSPQKYFELWGSMKINQSKMAPYVMYNGTRTNISCQVTDENLDLPYSNVNISFYNNVTGYLNSSVSNSSGWANISYIEKNIGSYKITCNVSTQNPDYLLAGVNNYKNQILTVKENNTDISPPLIKNVTASPLIFSVGGITKISANVTDNYNVSAVYLNVTLPNSSSYEYLMAIGSKNDIYEYNFSRTNLDGTYNYYILAYDNSSNAAWSSSKSFTVAGIRTYIGIKTTKDVYKIGEKINLTTYTRVSSTNTSKVSELGDVNYIYYSFDASDEGWTHSGAQDEWERGVPSDTDVNTCDSGNCWATDLDANYNDNANNNIQSPVIDMSGRTNTIVNFWREIDFQDATNDKIYFEVYDGSSWNILYQNTIGATNQEGAFYTYYPSEMDGVSNARMRFRTTTNGAGNQDGFAFDSLNLSFSPRIDWNKSWVYYNNSFGTDNNKTTAIKITINITEYDSTGSDLEGSASPDLEIEIYNSSSVYNGNYKCNLDSSKSYPYICSFIIKNTPEYLDAWKTSSNRNIRIRALNMDGNDNLNWTGVIREYVTPSIIENHGIAQVTSILLQQFENSSGGIVKTMFNSSITLNASETKQLNDYWNFSVPNNFKLGNYSAYVALTDSFGNVLQNEDDNTYINDSHEFSVQSLIIDVIRPLMFSVQNESFLSNITLNTTYFTGGGWCAYILDFNPNISMNLITPTNFNKILENITDGIHNISFECNDSDDYIVSSDLIFFNVSQNPRIDFFPTSELNNSAVNRSWIFLNVSINDSTFNSSWLVWDSVIENVSCSSKNILEHSCFINKSQIKNGIYSYYFCANDSLGNSNCTQTRVININKSLPEITIISPSLNEKFILGENISLNISTSIPANWSGYSIDSNFSNKFNLTQVSSLDWFDIISNLTTGYHVLHVFVNDSIDNQLNKSVIFYIIPDKSISIKKKIFSRGDDWYEVNLNVTNYGNYGDYILYDFIEGNFSYSNLSILNDGSNSISGQYSGTLLTWNLSLTYMSFYNISYLINSSFYNIKKTHILGLD